MPELRLSHLAYPVSALGPGQRLALWVAGCRLRCRHCITPELLDPAGGHAFSIDQVAQRILALPLTLDGITLSGGEPFDQASALSALLKRLRGERPDWSVLIFSGYPLTALQKRNTATQRLLEQTDILVAGPYVDTLPASHPLAASSNQKIHYLSERGQALQAVCDELPWDSANLGLSRSGADWLIGIISGERRQRIHRKLVLNTDSNAYVQ